MRNLILAAVCASLALPVAAAPKVRPVTLEEVVKKVQAQQKKTTTIQADFRQEKELALLAKPEVSTGRFVYSKPNNVLVAYESPKRVQMAISGGVLTTWFPDLNKVEKIEVKRMEDRIFKYMGATAPIEDLERYFNFTFTDNATSPVYALELSPKNAAVGKRVKRIRMWIDKKTYVATKFEYVEADGDLTRYEMTNVRINEPVAQGRFTLAIPAGTKVEQMKVQ